MYRYMYRRVSTAFINTQNHLNANREILWQRAKKRRVRVCLQIVHPNSKKKKKYVFLLFYFYFFWYNFGLYKAIFECTTGRSSFVLLSHWMFSFCSLRNVWTFSDVSRSGILKQVLSVCPSTHSCVGERELVFVLLVHLFVCFARVGFVLFSLPLGVEGWLRFVIVALPGLFY